MTQEELADMIGVKRETYKNWERGTREIKAISVIMLAEFFEVTCEEILCDIKPEYVKANKEFGLSNYAFGVLKRANNPKWSSTDKEIALESALSKNTLKCINILLEEKATLHQYRVIDYIQDYLDCGIDHKKYNLVDDETNEKTGTLKVADILAIKLLQIQEALVVLKQKITKNEINPLLKFDIKLLNE